MTSLQELASLGALRIPSMYWLVCLPILESEERTWTLLQNKTTYESDLSINFKFAIPELRVGTLDILMGLSDDLVKVNALVESVVNKIRRQLFEMASPGRDDDFQEVRPQASAELTEGKSKFFQSSRQEVFC